MALEMTKVAGFSEPWGVQGSRDDIIQGFSRRSRYYYCILLFLPLLLPLLLLSSLLLLLLSQSVNTAKVVLCGIAALQRQPCTSSTARFGLVTLSQG